MCAEIQADAEDTHTGLCIIGHPCHQLPSFKEIREYYTMLAKTDVHHYSGNIAELGTAHRKHCRVRTLAVIDAGDSDIPESMPEWTGNEETQKAFL